MRMSLFKMIIFPLVFFWSSIILKPDWSPEWARPYVDPSYNEADNYDLGFMFIYYPHRLIELTKEDFILAFKSGDKVATLTAKWFKEKKVPYRIDIDHGKLFVALKPFNNISKYRELRLYDSSKEIALVKEEKPRNNVFLTK